eukprot:CAMPEP_0197697130 /NCGR_PEP_ID=MMETSP1338-20131121/117548_1 /TAXON_ID=43686 ORGANISM="Pelagodinium beii, Strain RCC1491" /NCGR_SAMPLE_ID=MMETSP1338 /ASSEMBLY_ACC=CAM_ASM_000754 /LENGTH=108 /DNA_ID=CAMNT_0043280343 /DNA_START=227 /DNA_END=550 /DNA_ORIENTATION=+
MCTIIRNNLTAKFTHRRSLMFDHFALELYLRLPKQGACHSHSFLEASSIVRLGGDSDHKTCGGLFSSRHLLVTASSATHPYLGTGGFEDAPRVLALSANDSWHHVQLQ